MLDNSYSGLVLSQNTCVVKDLVNAFLAFIKQVEPEKAKEIEKNIPELMWEKDDTHPFWCEDARYILEDLVFFLGEIAPEDHYFGTSDADGCLWGFWQNEDE
jgi:transcription elongation factor GreA-like protein